MRSNGRALLSTLKGPPWQTSQPPTPAEAADGQAQHLRTRPAQVADKYGERADALVRAVALDVTSATVMRTPVDTGRAMGNWQLTIGAPAAGTVTALDPSGAITVAKARAALAGYRTGSSIFVVNNLPYILPLEYGSSKKAPAGMLRITLREWRTVVANAARRLK